MELELVKKTGKEIWEALNDFGVHHVRERWLEQNGAKVDACILGGTAFNLGVVPATDYSPNNEYTLENQLGNISPTYEVQERYNFYAADVAQFLIGMNDAKLNDEELQERYTYEQIRTFPVNDERRYRFNFYTLKEAAREALAPYADREFLLEVYDLDQFKMGNQDYLFNAAEDAGEW